MCCGVCVCVCALPCTCGACLTLPPGANDTDSGRYYEVWLAYVNMERGLRNLREARNIFKRAYSRRLEESGQPLLCAEWLRFEREEGRWVDRTLTG